MADNRLMRLARALGGGNFDDAYLGPPATIGRPRTDTFDWLGYNHPLWAMRHGRPPNPLAQPMTSDLTQNGNFTSPITPQIDANGNEVRPNQPTDPGPPGSEPPRQPMGRPNRAPGPMISDPILGGGRPNNHGPVFNKPNWPDWYTGGKRPQESYGVPSGNGWRPGGGGGGGGFGGNRAPGPVITDPGLGGGRPNSHGPVLNKPGAGSFGNPAPIMRPMPLGTNWRGQAFSGGRN